MKKICSWCNKRKVIDNDPDYYTCKECLATPKGGFTNMVKIFDKI